MFLFGGRRKERQQLDEAMRDDDGRDCFLDPIHTIESYNESWDTSTGPPETNNTALGEDDDSLRKSCAEPLEKQNVSDGEESNDTNEDDPSAVVEAFSKEGGQLPLPADVSPKRGGLFRFVRRSIIDHPKESSDPSASLPPIELMDISSCKEDYKEDFVAQSSSSQEEQDPAVVQQSIADENSTENSPQDSVTDTNGLLPDDVVLPATREPSSKNGVFFRFARRSTVTETNLTVSLDPERPPPAEDDVATNEEKAVTESSSEQNLDPAMGNGGIAQQNEAAQEKGEFTVNKEADESIEPSTNGEGSSEDAPRRGVLRHVASAVGAVWSPANNKTKLPVSPEGGNVKSLRGIYRRRYATWIHGCEDDEEHYAKVLGLIYAAKEQHGEEGLTSIGFEYRLVPCDKHKILCTEGGIDTTTVYDTGEEATSETSSRSLSENPSIQSTSKTTDTIEVSENDSTDRSESLPLEQDPPDHDEQPIPSNEASSSDSLLSLLDDVPVPQFSADVHENKLFCPECATRLFHIRSDTMITEENRKSFIADGDLYEEVTRLCQEYAQELMQQEGKLEWVTICNDESKGEPVRALVDHDNRLVLDKSGDECADSSKANSPQSSQDRNGNRAIPVLLIITGKGKVRAGIFSRQHLLTTGIEASTGLPMIREAKRRGMKVVVLDPNARGDRKGMVTFEQSIRVLFGHRAAPSSEDQPPTESDDDSTDHLLYVLAHSAAGAQLVRYLMDKTHDLSSIQAIAFTDSTHNIQWTKKSPSLANLLESGSCLYFKSADQHRDADWQHRKLGEAVDTDKHWHHRYGKIKTLWAGTHEHALTNWVAHEHIWDHFDNHVDTTDEKDDTHVLTSTPPSSPSQGDRMPNIVQM